MAQEGTRTPPPPQRVAASTHEASGAPRTADAGTVGFSFLGCSGGAPLRMLGKAPWGTSTWGRAWGRGASWDPPVRHADVPAVSAVLTVDLVSPVRVLVSVTPAGAHGAARREAGLLLTSGMGASFRPARE